MELEKEKKENTWNLEVDKPQLKKAIVALLTYLKKQNEQSAKKTLIETPNMISLSITFSRAPKEVSVKPQALSIPHSLNKEPEICFIIKDDEKLKQTIKESGIATIKKIIPIAKLKKNYKSYEEKRKLCHSYDLFLADDRVVTMLAKPLGKEFYSRKKQPYPVKCNKNLASAVEDLINSTPFFYNGDCCFIKVGQSSMSEDQIVENVMAVLPQLQKKVKYSDRVISLGVKSEESPTLPFYNRLPNLILEPKLRMEGEEVDEDEEKEEEAADSESEQEEVEEAEAEEEEKVEVKPMKGGKRGRAAQAPKRPQREVKQTPQQQGRKRRGSVAKEAPAKVLKTK